MVARAHTSLTGLSRRAAEMAVAAMPDRAWIVDIDGGDVVAASAAAKRRSPQPVIIDIDLLARLRTIADAASTAPACAPVTVELPLPRKRGRGTTPVEAVCRFLPGGERRIVLIRALDVPDEPRGDTVVQFTGPAPRVRGDRVANIADARIAISEQPAFRQTSSAQLDLEDAIAAGGPALTQDTVPFAVTPLSRLPASPEDGATLADIARRIRGEVAVDLPHRPVENSPLSAPAAPPQAMSALAHGGIDLELLSHELRTPIGAIAALAEIIRDEQLGAMTTSVGRRRYRDYANDIVESARHALAVLSGLTEAARASHSDVKQGDNRDLPARPGIDLGALADAVVAAMLPIAMKRGITMSMRQAGPVPLVPTSPRDVRQILFNLVSNAIKATQAQGSITVSVRAMANGVELAVTDTGSGMPADYIAAALDGRRSPSAGLPAEADTARSGMGLAIVKQLCDGIGGGLDIASTPGEGTRVAIMFDAATAVTLSGSSSQAKRTA